MSRYFRACVLALTLCGAANAQVTLTLTPAIQSGAPGSTITYSGFLTNLGATEVFINSDTFSLVGFGLTLDDTLFTQNAPLSLSSGATSETFDVFQVAIDQTAFTGSYPGTFTVQGGADVGITDPLTTTDFTVNVSSGNAAAPEPGSGTYLWIGALLAGGLVLRRRPQG